MGKNFHWKVILILLILGGSVWASYPPQQKIHLGLDLKGGIHLLLKVETAKLPEKQREDAVDRAIEIIRNRIDQFGVQEPIIVKQGREEIVVQLPGLTDETRAREIVSKTAHLEFKLVSDDDKLLRQAIQATHPSAPSVEKETVSETPPTEATPNPANAETQVQNRLSDEKKEPETLLPAVVPEGFELKEMEAENDISSQSLLVEKEPVLTGDHLTNAAVAFDQYGQAIVEFQLDKKGAEIFDDVTFRNIGKRLAIVLDGKVHSAPVIRDRIPGGRGQISGNFTPAQASDLALVLRAGALPAPVSVVEHRTVGPSLGRDSIESGVRAAIGGAFMVVLFMGGYYLFPGMVASLAVVLNFVIIMGFLALSGASLTLPGIAGIILTIGMAVDANVLINERMREELRLGKAIRSVISAGYHKAFSAIFDSNLTTILSASILLWFGTGPVRGFSVTLMFGLAASFFTAIFVTRVVFDFLTRGNHQINLRMMELIKEPKIDWISRRFIGYALSFILIVGSIAVMAIKKDEILGIDFVGGTLQEIQLKKEIDLSVVRAAFQKNQIPEFQLSRYGDAKDKVIVVRSKAESSALILQSLGEAIGEGNYEIRRSDSLGPTAGKELFSKAVKALALSFLVMLAYVWYRFNFRFAVCAILMPLHDAIGSMGVFVLTGREFSLSVLAAVLTIIGYSINDTIVIYDRIRENLKQMRKAPLREVLNKSMNQMVSRTLLTTGVTLLVVIGLYLFGGTAINDFAFILLVGFILGVYSTAFFAAPLIYDTSSKK